jgi:hypothetical protein
MRYLPKKLILCAVLFCIFACAEPLRAEDYEPIVAGGFKLTPKIVLQQSYSDNIYADDDNEESDHITAVKPSLLIEKSIRDHQFALETDVEALRYWENSDESELNFKSELRGRVVARRVLALPFKLSYSSDHLDRVTHRGALTREPTGFKMFKAEIGADYKPSRFGVGFYTGYNQRRYENGDDFNNNDVINDDADYDTVYARIIAKYESKADWTPFVSLQLDQNDYLRGTHDGTGYNGLKRDNRVLRAMAGAEFDDGEMWKGSASIGQDWRKYDEDSIDDVTALSAEGYIEWKPFKKLKLALDFLRRTEEESTINNGIVETDVDFGINYEFQQDLFFNAGVGWENTEFEGIDRTDDLYSGTVGISYVLNSKLEAGASYLHRFRESSQFGSDFDENIFMLRLTSKF